LHDIKDLKDNHCILIADQISDPQNLGQILRTSECAGIDGKVQSSYTIAILSI
jgi:tRNA G18 (ribose-2'-O)-methylase SpoU